MAEGGAALPWGNAGPEAAPIERDLPSSLGLLLGTRVEVLWQVEPEEGQGAEAATTKVSSRPAKKQSDQCFSAVCWDFKHNKCAPACSQWWGAVLDSRPEGATDGEGRQCYVLRCVQPNTARAGEWQLGRHAPLPTCLPVVEIEPACTHPASAHRPPSLAGMCRHRPRPPAGTHTSACMCALVGAAPRRYDPDPENGFHEQECCKATFLEDRECPLAGAADARAVKSHLVMCRPCAPAPLVRR